ncbi:hypothetical protein KFK09_006333 [Dendrobium nobile]|uniref:Mitochondrial protein n=1 Tax=Dendrobium nobile TaxID=94219 RepID=A0A8T3BRU5_DENNO|nr:hypothetical protein KFK09_006333 [Dendrobium nobile]
MSIPLFSTNILCQSIQNPINKDFQQLKHLLRYIKGSTNLGLPIDKENLQLHTYADSSWASNFSDQRSITGYCSFLGDTLLSWHVKKQPTVTKSSTKAEYRALVSASDIVWLRRLLSDFSITLTSPTKLHCDNVSALALANNPVFHARTKHIEIDYHFIWHSLQ